VSDGCAPNIKGAGYGATLLPIKFVKKTALKTEDEAVLKDADWRDARVSDDPVLPSATNLSACVALCRARPDCVAVSWSGPGSAPVS